ncbi:MAG: murein L,D-transpeptidase catalytic domain family protein [Mucilaginibacter sp.]
MKKPFFGLFCILFALAVINISWKSAKFSTRHADVSAKQFLQKYLDNIYESAHLQESGLTFEVFKKAMTGFVDLKIMNKLPQSASVLTVVDFTKSSHEKRMWIIDVPNKTLLLNTLVAHGRGSGEDMATQFSDKMDSHQSSLGFYITDDVYYGKNGRSLRLDGMDEGFNTNARARAIVVHGAGYVSEGAIAAMGHLGRSYGCPAVPPELADQVINTIKGKTLLFINCNNCNYTSKFLDEDLAANYVFPYPGNSFIVSL